MEKEKAILVTQVVETDHSHDNVKAWLSAAGTLANCSDHTPTGYLVSYEQVYNLRFPRGLGVQFR